jgi:bacteriocin-like protein
MSDEKRTDEKKPISEKDLDKVSGGHIQAPSTSTANHPEYGPPPYHGKGPQPD